MKMRREIFSRGVRMSHPFDELIDRSDPLGTGSESFEMFRPMRADDLSKHGRELASTRLGQHNDRPDSSPICKPNGSCARMDGPLEDEAMDQARPVPVGTKRRLGPLRTDK